ncbi:MAG: hypothetical protein U9N80_08200 [Chloroflexota bacterium]|nr:hypothetical protein [Chloroflexota bacterium]
MEVITRASMEVQIIMAIGALSAIIVFVAAINLWFGTTGNDRNNQPPE